MLGIFLLYFIGKEFYKLAAQYEKNQWGFAIGGIISYYLGTFIGGIIIGLVGELSGWFSVDKMENFALGILALPFGILSCYGLYKYLAYKWELSVETSNEIDFIGQDQEE